MSAAWRGTPEVARVLLNNGAAVDMKDTEVSVVKLTCSKIYTSLESLTTIYGVHPCMLHYNLSIAV